MKDNRYTREVILGRLLSQELFLKRFKRLLDKAGIKFIPKHLDMLQYNTLYLMDIYGIGDSIANHNIITDIEPKRTLT